MNTSQSSQPSTGSSRPADQLYAPNGKRIVASKDWVPGNALIQGASRLPDGSLEIEWAGETTLCWDGQYTERDGVARIFLDEDANEWAEHRLVLGGEDVLKIGAASPQSNEGDSATVANRIALAARALEAAYGKSAEMEDSVAELLTDLRHLCDGRGLDFAQLDRAAYGHYAEENAASRHGAMVSRNLPTNTPDGERERLLSVWRLNPGAEVDLNSEGDATWGMVRLADKAGNAIARFRFSSAEEADRAVDYALTEMQK